MSRLSEGSIVGNYRILRKLGEGGMGAVFEAVHTGIGRHVAIKVLHPEHAVREDVVGRFFNEARAANLIDHPSIVQIADFGRTDNGMAYIVMEFLRGEALSKRVRKGLLPVSEAVDLTRQIASALSAAHDKHIVHRDLKPDNIMLIPDPERPGSERLKLLDFGIAKLVESESPGHVKTRTNMLMGTPAYMSPEQCRGANRVDGQADVYSLGVMFYEMLSGRLPYIADDAGSLIGMHLYEQPPPLHTIAPHVPEPVARLAHRLLAKDKKDRPSMRELVAELQELASGGGALTVSPARGLWLPTLLRRVFPRMAARTSTLDSSTGQARTAPHKAKSTALPGSARLPILLMSALLLGGGAYVVLQKRRPERQAPLPSSPSPQPGPPQPTATAQAAEPGAKAEARKVVWEIASDPPGAEVIRMDDRTVLGKTPLTHEQPARVGRIALGLRLAGYQLTQVTLDQQTSGQVDKRLLPLRPSSPAAPGKPGPQPTAPNLKAAAKPPTKPLEPPHVPSRPNADEFLEK